MDECAWMERYYHKMPTVTKFMHKLNTMLIKFYCLSHGTRHSKFTRDHNVKNVEDSFWKRVRKENLSYKKSKHIRKLWQLQWLGIGA